jgi:hypothetical protein
MTFKRKGRAPAENATLKAPQNDSKQYSRFAPSIVTGYFVKPSRLRKPKRGWQKPGRAKR